MHGVYGKSIQLEIILEGNYKTNRQKSKKYGKYIFFNH